MSDLISGKEALIALANGKEVEFKVEGGQWVDVSDDFELKEFKRGVYLFHLKPQTITVNGIKVPKPFEPEVDEVYWVLDTNKVNGYSRQSEHIPCLAWRTEDEIKQVVEALKSVFKPQ